MKASLFILSISSIFFISCLTSTGTATQVGTESDFQLTGEEGELKLLSQVELSENILAVDRQIEGKGSPEFFIPGSSFSANAKFSPGGRYLLSVDGQKMLSLWSVNPLEEIRTYPVSENILNFSFSNDGSLVFAQTMNEIYCWRTSSGELITLIKPPLHTDYPMIINFTVIDNSKIIIATNGELFVWDINSNKSIKKITATFSKTLAVPGSTQFISYFGNKLEAWDWNTAKKKWSVTASGGVYAKYTDLQLSFDGKTVFALSSKLDISDPKKPKMSQDASVVLLDSLSGSIKKSLSLGDGVISIYPHPDDTHLFYGSTDHHIKVINSKTKKNVIDFLTLDAVSTTRASILASMPTLLFPISISPDGRMIYWGGMSQILWNLYEGEIRGEFVLASKSLGGSVTYISDDGKYLVNLGRVWDVSNGTVLSNDSPIVRPMLEKAKGPSFGAQGRSHDNKVKLESNYTDKEVKLLDARSGSVLHLLKGHKSAGIITSVFSEDDTLLATAGVDHLIQIWDVGTGISHQVVESKTGLVNSLLFSPDKKRIYAADSRGCNVYSVADGSLIGSFYLSGRNGWVSTSSSGHFNGNEEGLNLMRVRMGNRVLPLESFYEQFFNPLKVAAAFSDHSEVVQQQTGLKLSDISAPPPTVSILLEVDGGNFKSIDILSTDDLSVETATVRIRVKAQDNGGGVGAFHIRNNGKILEETVRGLGRKTENSYIIQDFEIPLAEGINNISAAVVSSQLIESIAQTFELSYVPIKIQAPDMYVLAIGIDEYKNERYNLDYAVGDVRGFLSSLNVIADSLYDEIITTIILNSEANKENIENQFSLIASQAQAEDVFVFFYAGHGIALSGTDFNMKSEFFYVLHNVTQMTNEDKILSSGISGSEVKEYFTSIPAMKQIALIDACNSGAFAESFAYRGAAEEQALGKLSKATGSAIIAATRDDQSALELSDLGHGAFTMAVIEALNGEAAGSNHQVTAASLRLYLDDRLPAITAEYYGSEQYPISFMFGQDFPIGLK